MLVRIGATLLLLLAYVAGTPLRGEEVGEGSRGGGSPAVLPESARRLQEYLQIDTTNPPGNEKAAAELLAGWLREIGAEPRLVGDPNDIRRGRASVYARFAASGPPCPQGGGALLLIHHIDVVPAGDGWEVPPFSGRLENGRIWGRGAIDIKSLGIAQLEALGELKRRGRRLCRDVVYLGVADEEAGGIRGTGYLLERQPELFAGVDAVINEGGSNRTFGGRQIFWGIEVMQKRPLWVEVSAGGRGGHGSRYAPSSAAHQLLRGLTRLIDRPPRYRLGDEARLYFGEMGRLEGRAPAASVAKLEKQIRPDGPPEPPLEAGLQTYFLDTLQVTEIQTGEGINVVSPVAKAYLDIRLLPDTDADAYLAEMRAVLGPELEVRVVLSSPPAEPSPMDHPLYRAFEQVLGQRAPVVPSFLPGTTDSRYFRARGIAAYGFSPFSVEGPDLRGIHAPNEYIRLDDFLRGVETTRRLIESYATAP